MHESAGSEEGLGRETATRAGSRPGAAATRKGVGVSATRRRLSAAETRRSPSPGPRTGPGAVHQLWLMPCAPYSRILFKNIAQGLRVASLVLDGGNRRRCCWRASSVLEGVQACAMKELDRLWNWRHAATRHAVEAKPCTSESRGNPPRRCSSRASRRTPTPAASGRCASNRGAAH